MAHTHTESSEWGACPYPPLYPHAPGGQEPWPVQSYPLPPSAVSPYYYYPQPEYGYAMEQYVPMPGYGVPPPPPAHYCYYHAPQPQPPPMPHGAWYGDGPSVRPLERHSRSLPFAQDAHDSDTERDPESRYPRRRPSKKGGEPTAFEVLRHRELATALDFVRQSSRATLFDVDGVISAMACASEEASRFIHARLRVGSGEEKRLGLTTAVSSIDDLARDRYGCLMLQGLFEFGSVEVQQELLEAIFARDTVALCVHMHGCRVIQKALLHLGPEDSCRLFSAFQDEVQAFNHDINGNHVIKSCIRGMTSSVKSAAKDGDPEAASGASDQLQLIVDAIVASVERTSTNRFGCRVVQAAIESCVGAQKDAVLDSIMDCHERLAMDQYGNYVVQHVVRYGGDANRAAIVETLTRDGALLSSSKHKYASNVIEAVLVYGASQEKEKMLEAMLEDTSAHPGSGCCCLLDMSKDPIANYVVNKAIEVSRGDQENRIFELIFCNRQELSQSPYAKYVLQWAHLNFYSTKSSYSKAKFKR